MPLTTPTRDLTAVMFSGLFKVIFNEHLNTTKGGFMVGVIVIALYGQFVQLIRHYLACTVYKNFKMQIVQSFQLLTGYRRE